MDRRTKIGASIAAGVSAVVAVAAIAVASPETGAQTADSTPNPSTSTAPQDGSGKGMSRPQETPLTGAALEDATAAAKAAVPGGTILRVETDGDGGATYEAHVRKSDGTEVVVMMDKEFKVTGVEAFTGRGGPGGRGGMAGPNETPLTGAEAEKATAAAKAAVEGGTVIRVETDGDGGAAYEAHVRKADGTEVVVKMDKEFKVTGVEAFTGRGGPGGHRGGDGPRGTQDGSGSGSSSSAAPSSTNGA
ncbi:MAG TPA: PepSY domain-containing protein [Candidatus Nanopelagicales bacterium]